MQPAADLDRVGIRRVPFAAPSARGGGIGQEHAELQLARGSRRALRAPALLLSERQPMVELPPLNVKRWTIRRKAAVVTAVAAGEITREEICRRYQISEEEFLAWQRAYEAHGLPGLRSTRLQQYRRSGPRR